MSDDPVRGLAEVFEGDIKILVAYMFGSKSRGLHTPESDTDIAVLLSELPENLLDYYLDLTDRVSRVLGDAVDLVVLNTAPPLLRHQVIKYGRVLYNRDERARVEFEARAGKEYLDLKRRRERYDEALMEEISRWKG